MTIRGIGGGGIPPSGGGGSVPPSGPGDDGPNEVKKEKPDDDEGVVIDINPKRDVEPLLFLASTYGPANDQRLLEAPEHLFTNLLALDTLSETERAGVKTAYERWKILRQLRGTMYPLPVQPVDPVEPVGDRPAEPDSTDENDTTDEDDEKS